jgi:hypothetical protein
MTGTQTPTADRPRPNPSAPTGPNHPSPATPTTTFTLTIILTVDDADYEPIRVDVLPEAGPVGVRSPARRAHDDVDGLSALGANRAHSPASGLPVYSAALPSPSTSRRIRSKLAVAAIGLVVLAGLLWLSQPDRRAPATAPSVPTSVAAPDGASPSTEVPGPTTSTPYPHCSVEVIPCAQPWPNALAPDADVGVSP